ncbi:MAG: hypothetical protein ABJC12_01260 [Saprospiraceae bacterium]
MLEGQYKVYLQKNNFIFFDLDGSKVPFEIDSVEEGAHLVLSLTDLKNKKDSDALSGVEFFIPLESVNSKHQHSPKNIRDKWDEYRIRDTISEVVFQVIRVEEFPQQLMAIILIGSKEILIPLSDKLISSIDKKNRIIHMEIPEGLLDL